METMKSNANAVKLQKYKSIDVEKEPDKRDSMLHSTVLFIHNYQYKSRN